MINKNLNCVKFDMFIKMVNFIELKYKTYCHFTNFFNHKFLHYLTININYLSI